MKVIKLCLTFDFWLPWMIGYGCGWGCQWFDLGPFTLWSSGDIDSLAYQIAVFLYGVVNERFGPIAAGNVDMIYFILTGESRWICNTPKKGKSP